MEKEQYEQKIKKLQTKLKKMKYQIVYDYLEQIARYKVMVAEYETDISSLKKEIYQLRENISIPEQSDPSRAFPWHCVYCGTLSTNPANDYLCLHCQKIRPYIGPSSTLVKCTECLQFNFSLAIFCEWCGEKISPNY